MVNHRVSVLAMIVAVTVGQVHSHFEYELVNAHDPENVAVVREALTTLGINPNGINIKSIYANDWALGTSYKVTYRDAGGKKCFLHFRDKHVTGISAKGPPTCDNREIGNGGR